jgi:hypothetical protein
MATKKKKKIVAKIKKRPVRPAKPRKKVSKSKAKAKAVKKVKQPPAIGVITHYFPQVRAGVIKLKSSLAVGDVIKIKGHTTDFTQVITSMQINHVPVDSAKKGAEIGLLVNSRVRHNDLVYKG